MPVNRDGEEVDSLDYECPECGSDDIEELDEQHHAYAAWRCLACGYIDM